MLPRRGSGFAAPGGIGVQKWTRPKGALARNVPRVAPAGLSARRLAGYLLSVWGRGNGGGGICAKPAAAPRMRPGLSSRVCVQCRGALAPGFVFLVPERGKGARDRPQLGHSLPV